MTFFDRPRSQNIGQQDLNKGSAEELLVLEELRAEISGLRVDNKLLARNLHVERYVSKNEVQRALNDLRGENARLQRDNEVARDRINVKTKRATDQESAFDARKIEVANTEKEIEELLREVEELNSVSMSLEDENEKVKQNNIFMKHSNENLEQEVNSLVLTSDKETTLIKDLKSDIENSEDQLKKLQNNHCAQLIEAKRRQESMQCMQDEKEKLLQNIHDLENNLRCKEEKLENFQEKKKKLEKEYDFLKQRQEADAAKHSVILNVLQDFPKECKEAQTDSFMETENKSSSDGKSATEKQGYERGTIVRVMGLGENTKRKFGKDLEIRATSYSKHVNLNVKLNK